MKRTSKILASPILIVAAILLFVYLGFSQGSGSLIADGAPLPYPKVLVADGAPLPYPKVLERDPVDRYLT